MKRIRYYLIFMLLIAYSAKGQGQDIELKTYSEKKYDTAYIDSFRDDLVLGISFPSKYINFSLNDVKNKRSLEYQPNTSGAIGIKGSYKWLGLALSYGFPLNAELRDQKGNTERLDFQMNAYLRKIVIDAYFQYYKGFFLEDMDNYFEDFDWENDEYYIRPDLALANVGISVKYVWNHEKFSYKAAYDFNEKQKKRAGSFLIGGYTFISAMGADSIAVPHFALSDFTEESYFTSLSSINIGVSAGYIYTFVIKKKFFITLGFVPGIGIQTIYALNDKEEVVLQKSGLGATTTFRASLGYSKKRFYTAITGVSGSNNLNNKDKTAINFGYGNANFIVGYRFSFKKRSN